MVISEPAAQPTEPEQDIQSWLKEQGYSAEEIKKFAIIIQKTKKPTEPTPDPSNPGWEARKSAAPHMSFSA